MASTCGCRGAVVRHTFCGCKVNMLFGECVRRLRVAGKFTQRELGKMIGRSNQWVSLFERGGVTVAAVDLMRIEVALGVEPGTVHGYCVQVLAVES
ncbi:MAG: helix-turn-helix domain-containing protein [Nannocystaceae bacterium]